MSKLEWLICCDPVHIGGADSDSRGNRNPIYRLPDGTPAIPGSSLRGALREHTLEETRYRNYEEIWFGSRSNNTNNQSDGEEAKLKAGSISLGWAFPLWFPVHVMGYGNWWITCPGWLNRFWQLNGNTDFKFFTDKEVYSPNESFAGKSLYFRWLKLTDIQHYGTNYDELPLDGLNGQSSGFDIQPEKCLIVPDNQINLFVDMGLVRQPRVSLKNREEAEQNDDDGNNSLVKNLFSVEGLPPGAIFFFAWTTRNVNQHHKQPIALDETETTDTAIESINDSEEQWQNFLHAEHYIGGLWSVGYGRVLIRERPTNF